MRRVPLPPKALLALGRISDVVGRYVPLGDGLSYEAALLLTSATPTDDRATTEDLGLTWRPPRQAIIESFAAARVSDPGIV